MQNLLNDLKEILQQDERLVVDGKLLKNKIIELGLQLDPSLLKLLLANPSLKKHFFQEVETILVFDKVKFQKFVSNKSFLPDSYTSFKNKIGLTTNDEYLSESKEVVLSWPYKDCVLEGGQTKEDSKRNELFWNEILAPDEIDRLLTPKVLSNFKKYSSNPKDKIVDFSLKDNLIIKGNNLLVLHSILKIFRETVKIIYIDPPYNTGNDSFKYNDSFNHSTWLTFMKNRLEVARELLSNDGFILIQIDNNEEGYLKVLCDEVFGRENYRNSIITKKGTKSLQIQFSEIQRLNAGFDTILLYSKNASVKLPNLFKELKGATAASWNNHWRGTDRPTMRYELFGIEPERGQWRWEKKRTEKAVENYLKLCEYIKVIQGKDYEITDDLINLYYEQYIYENSIIDHSDFELVRMSKNNKPEHYIPPRMKVLLSENWMDLSVSGRVTMFEHEKNEEILKRIIEWLSNKGDTVLDFFLGSGTTAAVSHKLERHYIGIEQMEYGNEDAVNRLLSVIEGNNSGISKEVNWEGGGSFIYAELIKINQYYIDKIHKANDNQLMNIFTEIEKNAIIVYNADLVKFKENIEIFNCLSSDIKRNILLSFLDKNQLYINYSEIDDIEYDISEEIIKFNKKFYNLK